MAKESLTGRISKFTLTERLRSNNLWRSFNEELPKNNDAKFTVILLGWSVSSLAVMKTGGGVYEQTALGLLTALEGFHQLVIATKYDVWDLLGISTPKKIFHDLEENIFEAPRR